MAWLVKADGLTLGPYNSGNKAYDAIWQTTEQSADMAEIERLLAHCSMSYSGASYSYEFYGFRSLTHNKRSLAPWFKKYCGNIMPPRSISWMVCENPGNEIIGSKDVTSLPHAVHEMHTKLGIRLIDMILFDVAMFNKHSDAIVTRCLVRAASAHKNPRTRRR